MFGRKADLSYYNYMVIYSTLFLWILNMFFSFSVAVIWTIFQLSIVQNDPQKRASAFFRIIMQPMTWLINFLTVLGLLYLFHYQGVREVEKRKKKELEQCDLGELAI